MAEPFIGEIRMGGWNFAPQNFAFCNGQLLAISENSALFNLIGTTYGGDGQTTFALPNLQCRIPVHQGNGYVMGQLSGVETVTLQVSQLPAHNHVLNAQSGAGNQPSPAGGVWASSSLNQYSAGSPTTQMTATSLQNSGGSQPHDNMPPFQCISFVIALYGIYPSQS